MVFLSERHLSTLTNSGLVVIGTTAVLLATENNNNLFFHRRRFDWKDIAQRGAACGVGLLLSASGLVRQASMEHMLLKRSFDKNYSRSTCSSGIVPFAVTVVVGSVLGVYVLSSQQNEEDGDDRSIVAASNDNDEDGNDDGNTDGDNGTLFSTSSALRPTEDNSVGAEPLEDGGSVSQNNDGIVIRNDIMATIQDVLGATNEHHILDNNTMLSEEQTENDVQESDDDDDDDDDDDHSIEQQFSDLALESKKSFSPQ